MIISVSLYGVDNMKYQVKQNIKLIDFLLQNYNRKNAKKLLKYKQVHVNDQIVSQFDYLLKIGDHVTIEKQEQHYGLNIIYENDEFVVINKPAGLLSMSDGHEKEKTAYHMVSEYLKNKNKNNKVFIVHRLDRETSGVLMFCKNEKIRNILQDNWNDIVDKRGYIAFVEGKMKKKKGIIKNYLAQSQTQQVYITSKEKGKLAITHYRVIKESRYYSLLEIFLDTGRKNQIRVHLSSLGHPIVGDKKYGAKYNPIKRMGLHAHIFAFTHPLTHEKFEFVAKTPESFQLK